MNPIVVDVETTCLLINPKDKNGNVYAPSNRLCYVGCMASDVHKLWPVDLGQPYGDSLQEILAWLHGADLFVAFNLKFDWNWLRRYGVYLPELPVWDLQVAEFIISAQASPMPSLDGTLKKYGLGAKVPDIDEKYWSQGIDTPYIPPAEMETYLNGDLRGEWALWNFQVEYLADKPKLKRLIWEASQDEKITAEMEWNGLLYDLELSTELGNQKLARIGEIDKILSGLCGRDDLSWNSGRDISLALYGGTRYDLGWETYIFT